VRSFGLNAAITRGCNAWGEGQFTEKLVPIACKLLSEGKQVPLHGGGTQVRQWVHVDDFAETLVEVGCTLLRSSLAGEHDVLTVNIWGPDRLSVRELIEAIAKVSGVDHDKPWVEVSDRPGQDKSYGLYQGGNRWVLKTCPSRSILDVNEIIRLLECYASGDAVELASFCKDEVHDNENRT